VKKVENVHKASSESDRLYIILCLLRVEEAEEGTKGKALTYSVKVFGLN